MKKLIPLFIVVMVFVLVFSGCRSKSLGDTWTRPNDEMVMVYVPEGEFEMGSDDGQRGGSQGPAYTVALDGFWIDRTEVTNAQYNRCVEAGDCEEPGLINFGFKDEAKTDYPMGEVEWFEAEAYCEWAEARLPNEAEWEYAARGPEGLEYPWGDSAPDDSLLNYDENVGDTTEVGAFPDGASWCGALDMAGNVWEWVADWFGAYPSERQENPTGPISGEEKVLRGGGWKSTARGSDSVLSANRGATWTGLRSMELGFRCAKDAD